VWVVVTNRRYEPQVVANGVAQNKPKVERTDHDKKMFNIIWSRETYLFSLWVNEYNSISHCQIAKTMWDALETLHGTKDVKQSRINTLIQHNELFHMEESESISSMQMRFIHIVNKLQNLRKDISNYDWTNKVLRCMTRDWHPNVISIKESENLNTLGISTLFVQTFYNNCKKNPQ